MQKLKIRAGKALATMAKNIAIISTESRCIFLYHQPKMPANINMLKKSKIDE